jgi:hypothetical protein
MPMPECAKAKSWRGRGGEGFACRPLPLSLFTRHAFCSPASSDHIRVGTSGCQASTACLRQALHHLPLAIPRTAQHSHTASSSATIGTLEPRISGPAHGCQGRDIATFVDSGIIHDMHHRCRFRPDGQTTDRRAPAVLSCTPPKSIIAVARPPLSRRRFRASGQCCDCAMCGLRLPPS